MAYRRSQKRGRKATGRRTYSRARRSTRRVSRGRRSPASRVRDRVLRIVLEQPAANAVQRPEIGVSAAVPKRRKF